MFIYIHILSYYKLFLYFNLCLRVVLDSLIMFIYIHILSYYKLFLYFNLCLRVVLDSPIMFIYIHIHSDYKLFLYFNLCLRVVLDSLSCSFTIISFLTTSCYSTLICVYVWWVVYHVHLQSYPFLLQAVTLP